MYILIDSSIVGVYMAGFVKELDAKGEVTIRRLWAKEVFENSRSSISLVNYLHEGLRSHGKSMQDINSIVCAFGPGSFTGIKVGIAFAQGLLAGAGKGISYFPYSSALEYLYSRGKDSEDIVLFLPATKVEGFCLKLEKDHVINITGVVITSQGVHFKTIDLSEIAPFYPVRSNAETSVFASKKLLILNDWQELARHLAALPCDYDKVVLDQFMEQSSLETIERIVSGKRKKGEVLTSVPFFLRKSVPEEKKAAQQG